MTAGELITRSFRKLAISNPSTSDITDAISELNDMMRQLDVRFAIGWTPVSSSSDEITTPDWTWRMIILRLAIIISPEYGKQPPPALIADAGAAYKDLLDMVIEPIETAYPPDLPLGAGNTGMAGCSGGNFFGEQFADDILTGSGNPVLDEAGDTITQG